MGRDLVFEFVREHVPGDMEGVRNVIRRKGAYGKYKDLLEERGLLNKWCDFENAKQTKTLREWCEDEGIELID